jgi:hypothetical protein
MPAASASSAAAGKPPTPARVPVKGKPGSGKPKSPGEPGVDPLSERN